MLVEQGVIDLGHGPKVPVRQGDAITLSTGTT